MALIAMGHSKCFVCKRLLQEDDDIFATSHFIEDSSNPLWQYSDAPAHRACFLSWPHRKEFIRQYNIAYKDDWRGEHMLEDGTTAGRTPDQFAEWLGPDVYQRVRGGPGSLPLGLQMQQPDWFVLNAVLWRGARPLLERILRPRQKLVRAMLAGAPADLTFFKGRRAAVIRNGVEVGTVGIGHGYLMEVVLWDELTGYATSIDLLNPSACGVRSGDHLRLRESRA